MNKLDLTIVQKIFLYKKNRWKEKEKKDGETVGVFLFKQIDRWTRYCADTMNSLSVTK